MSKADRELARMVTYFVSLGKPKKKKKALTKGNK